MVHIFMYTNKHTDVDKHSYAAHTHARTHAHAHTRTHTHTHTHTQGDQNHTTFNCDIFRVTAVAVLI